MSVESLSFWSVVIFSFQSLSRFVIMLNLSTWPTTAQFFVNSFDVPSMFSCPMLDMFGENSINPSVPLSLQMRWLVLIVTCTCTYCVSLTVCCSVLGNSSLKQHLFYITSTDDSLVWDAKHLLSTWCCLACDEVKLVNMTTVITDVTHITPYWCKCPALTTSSVYTVTTVKLLHHVIVSCCRWLKYCWVLTVY